MSDVRQAGRADGWPRAVLFDLDGTLIDSVPDIAASVNRLMTAYHLPAHELAAVRAMIGDGVRKLVERAFAAHDIRLDRPALDERYERMMAIYGGHLTEETVLMPGAAEAIVRLRRNGTRLALVTNKPVGFSREILAHFGLSEDFELVVGGDSGPKRKPAPDMLHFVLDQFQLSASEVVMVGDGPADIDAARAAGIASIAVRGGYTTVPVDELGADCVIDRLDELASAVESLKEPV